MRFVELDLFGVYVAPMSVLMIVAWVVTITLRRLAARTGLLTWVWHPGLLVVAVYVVLLASLTLVAANARLQVP